MRTSNSTTGHVTISAAPACRLIVAGLFSSILFTDNRRMLTRAPTGHARVGARPRSAGRRERPRVRRIGKGAAAGAPTATGRGERLNRAAKGSSWRLDRIP